MNFEQELTIEVRELEQQLDVAREFCRQYQIENKQLRESTADCYEKNLDLNLENFELKVQLTALEKSLEDLQDKYEDVTSQEHSIPELRGQLLDSFAEKQKVLCCVERLTLSVTNTVKERDELMRKNNHLQFLLDSVMLEYCPDEMTEEQMENWKKAHKKSNLEIL